MHVPEEKLGEYRALMTLARRADSVANTRSGRGEYDRANRMWAIASMLRKDAGELRVPGNAEADAEPVTDKHRRTAYCAGCGETCKEWLSAARGWGWNCLHCGYLTDEEVRGIADRTDPTYSDGTAVRWVERNKLGRE